MRLVRLTGRKSQLLPRLLFPPPSSSSPSSRNLFLHSFSCTYVTLSAHRRCCEISMYIYSNLPRGRSQLLQMAIRWLVAWTKCLISYFRERDFFVCLFKQAVLDFFCWLFDAKADEIATSWRWHSLSVVLFRLRKWLICVFPNNLCLARSDEVGVYH